MDEETHEGLLKVEWCALDSAPATEAVDMLCVLSIPPLSLRLWCVSVGLQSKHHYEPEGLNDCPCFNGLHIGTCSVGHLQQTCGFQDTSHLQGFVGQNLPVTVYCFGHYTLLVSFCLHSSDLCTEQGPLQKTLYGSYSSTAHRSQGSLLI